MLLLPKEIITEIINKENSLLDSFILVNKKLSKLAKKISEDGCYFKITFDVISYKDGDNSNASIDVAVETILTIIPRFISLELIKFFKNIEEVKNCLYTDGRVYVFFKNPNYPDIYIDNIKGEIHESTTKLFKFVDNPKKEFFTNDENHKDFFQLLYLLGGIKKNYIGHYTNIFSLYNNVKNIQCSEEDFEDTWIDDLVYKLF